jgi:biopolymer transport protein ExbD
MPSQTQTWHLKPRRRSLLFARIERAPITVCFCLLFITVVYVRAVNDSAHHGRGVDLPNVHSANSASNGLRPNAISLAVARNGDMFVGTTKTTASDIPDRLRALSQPGVECRVYLKIDRQAKYADVSTALDSIRAAGISNITFLTNPIGRT